jgi:hypothetical protein
MMIELKVSSAPASTALATVIQLNAIISRILYLELVSLEMLRFSKDIQGPFPIPATRSNVKLIDMLAMILKRADLAFDTTVEIKN